MEARYVAKLIREKLDSGETLKEKGRPLQPGDFCILLRSPKGSAVQYEKALAKAGIESYCRFTGNYFLSREIMTMLSFLRVIDNPLQDIPMLALLMSPFFSFSPDDISDLRAASPERNLYPAIITAAQRGEEKCVFLMEQLSHFRRLSASLTVSELIACLYEETGYFSMSRKSYGGEARGDNLRLLLEYAQKYEEQGWSSLSGFLQFLDRVMERGGDLQRAKSAQLPESASSNYEYT